MSTPRWAAAVGSTKICIVGVSVAVCVMLVGGIAWGIQGIQGDGAGLDPVQERYINRRAEAVRDSAQTRDTEVSPIPTSIPTTPGTSMSPTTPTSTTTPPGKASVVAASAAPQPGRSDAAVWPGPDNFGAGGAGFNCSFAKTMHAGMSQDVECYGIGHQGFVGEVSLSCTAPAGMTCELDKNVVRPARQYHGGTESVPVNMRVTVAKGFPSGHHKVQLHYDAPTADPRIPHYEGSLSVYVADTSYFANCGPAHIAPGGAGSAPCSVFIPAGSYRGPIYLSVQSLTPGGPQPVLPTSTVGNSNLVEVRVGFSPDASVAPGQYIYELGTTHIPGGPPEPHRPGAPMMTNRFIVTVAP